MCAKRRAGLGKGLSSLLPDKPAVDEKAEDLSDVESYEIDIKLIDTNPFQPRQEFNPDALAELSESIRVQGVIQPIAIRKVGDRYQLISGERRLRAADKAGLKTIPAFIRDADDSQMLELGIIENIQREDLNPIEIASGYQRLIDECNLTIEELGKRVGKSRSSVNNSLRLLGLPDFVKQGLIDSLLSMGHARALLGIDDKGQIEAAYNLVLKDGLSVRKVEELVKQLNADQPEEAKPPKVKKERKQTYVLTEYQDSFEKIFDKKVWVEADENQKGEINIAYNSRTELDEILRKLSK